MTRAEQAKKYFTEGYNCSQAVVLAFADLTGAPREVLERIALPMGGGMGRLRETCGGVSGAAMTIGLLFPALTKSEIYALVQEFALKFKAKNGSYNCGELLAGTGASCSPNAEPRTAEYYQKRPCADLVADAVQLLEELCKEHGRL